MKNLLFIFISFSLVFLLSCTKDDHDNGPPLSDELNYIMHDNYNRSYILHVPPAYSKDLDMPLVVVLHGYTATAQNMVDWIHMNDKADIESFIVAYPNGLAYPWDERNPQAWNCGGPWEEWTQNTDDVGFINAMIDKIAAYYTIDPNRIFVTGHSNGSRMTHRLGIELSHKIAAIAPVSGQSVFDQVPDQPISVLHMHALNDPAVNYYGQHIPGEVEYESVDSILTRWASYYSCNTEPDTLHIEDNYLVKSWGCADKNIDILLYVMKQGEHQWFTPENSGVNANDVMWEFFKSHPKE